MALINQNVSEKEKTKEWIIGVGKHILQSSLGMGRGEWEKDQLCWNLYNSKFDETDLDYLRKVGDYEYPAKIRFFPVIRPYIDNLQSQHTLQPFNFIVYAFDNKSVEKKLNGKNQFYLDSIIDQVFDHRGKLKGAQQQAEQILQQIEQQMNPQMEAENQAGGVQPVSPQAIQAPSPQQVQMMDKQKQEFEKQLYILNQRFQVSEDDVRKIEIRYKMNDRETHEILAQRALEYLQFNNKLERVFNNGFLGKLVTDKAIYYNDWDGLKQDPEVRKVNEKYFYYAYDNAIDFVHEAEWCQEDQYMSVANVIDQFRFEISEEDMTYLNNKRASIGFSSEAEWFGSYGPYNQTNTGILSPMDSPSATCKISRQFFKSPRKVYWKKTPNRFLPGTPRHLMIDESDIPPLEKRKKDDEYLTYYINDIYETVFIDDRICVRARKKPIQNRSLDFYGNVPLPYSGIAWRSMNREASSPIYRTKDIQILYNIVHYHKELWLALSGAKGLIMDLSQKPEGMSMQEWTYQRKMGTGWIETMRKTGKNPSFNQFKTYDDSLGQGYQLLLNTLDHLERLCGKIIGIPPQRLGEIAADDQVGTSKIAINQSTLTTEVLFKEHDVVKGLVYEQLVNLVRFAWKEGKRGSYILGGQQMLLDIPSQILADQQYRLFIKSSSKEFNSLQTIQRAIENATMQGKMPTSQLAASLRIDNLTELEKTLQVFEQKAQAFQKEMIEAEANAKGQTAQQQEQIKAEFAAKLLELENQFAKDLQQGTLQIQNMEVEIKAAALAWQKQNDLMKAQIESSKLGVKSDEINLKSGNEQAKIESTRLVEGAYLDQADRFHEDEMRLAYHEVRQDDNNERMKIGMHDKVEHRKADTHQEIQHRKADVDEELKRGKHETEDEFKRRKATSDQRHQQQKHTLDINHSTEKNEVDMANTKKKNAMELEHNEMKHKLKMTLMKRESSNRKVKNEP